jgi:hypothetical protein
MSGAAFVTRTIPSRKLLTVEPLFVAAAVPAAPYPSYLEPKAFRRKELNRRILSTPENDEYPVNATNLPPAWELKTSNRSAFDQANQLVELNVYPVSAVDATNLPPAWALKAANQSQHNVKLLTPDHNDSYPATPPIPDQPLTAFMMPQLFRRHQRRNFVTLLDIDNYPVTPIPPPSDVWTIQPNETTSWTGRADETTTWTDKPDQATTWTVQ